MENEKPVVRPKRITALCILGFIGFPSTCWLLVSGGAKILGVWFSLWLALSAVIGLVSFLGLWKMRRWGMYPYVAFFLINQVILLLTHLWNIGSLIIPLVVILIMASSYKEMK